MYKAGAGMSTIGRKYKVSRIPIRKILREHSVESHGTADWIKKEIIKPTEFTPELGNLVALIVT